MNNNISCKKLYQNGHLKNITKLLDALFNNLKINLQSVDNQL